MASGAGGIGGGGGGKIRTRRCHQGPIKPYQQGRQKHQGILSRVTESVKNIVPGWLQRYFNKNEDVCSCSTDPREVPQWPENREDDHLIYADEESANIHDGRITPEPTVSNTEEEPSTTSTASNYPDVLTRPSLHRSHLNFSMLESPALHCQPSTSSAFPIGSSGFSLVKEIKDSTSQHDDDNISTTSGFSSRASDKDIAVSKNTSVPPLWSPEVERSHLLSQHTATSSKKPAFNLSAFGTLSPSIGNSSTLKTSQLGDSPFYPGKTTYGGAAAAVRHPKLQNTPYQAPVRRQMKAKQLSAQSYGVTSSTARRILQSLEKMSSPLADAKRIPSIVSSPLSSPLDRSGIDTTADHRAKRARVDSPHPPVQRLLTPKPVSVVTNRTVYFKPSLTPSGELRKTNQRIDKKYSTGYEKNMTPGQNREQESGFSYPNFSMSAANGLSSGVGSGGGKIRRERTRFVATKPPEEKEMEIPVLPKITLPISSSSLPTFSFSSPVITTSPSSISPAQSLTNKVQMTSPNNTGSPIFRFSSPIVKSTEADVLPPPSIGFTFSVPVAKTAELSCSSSISEPITSSSAQDITAVNSTNCKNQLEEDCECPFRPAKVLKEGSVLDILKSPGFTSPKADSFAAEPTSTSPVVYTRPAISSFSSSGIGFGESLKAGSSWQCDNCLLQNKNTDNKCIACQGTKLPKDNAKQTGIGTPSKSGKPTISASGTGFGDKFKPAVGTWDCDTCLVQNKPEAIKCVACETPKPGTGVKRVLTLPVASESAITMAISSSSCTVTTATLGFPDKFKRPVGSWECPVCCVSNNAEDNKCVSCMSEKPGSSVPTSSSSTVPVSLSSGACLGLDNFKKPEGSWDCEECLVQNKADSTKCVACESAKPGTKSEFKGFGTSSDPAAPSFKFGISSPSSGPSQTLTSTENFKFGDQGGFKIGVSSDSGSLNPMSEGFKFSKSTGNFKFGDSSDSKPEEVKKDSKNDNNFKFGLSSGLSNPASLASFQFGVSNLGQQEKKEELPNSSSAGFSFGTGVINPAPAATNTVVTSENKSSFSFGTMETKSVSLDPFTCKTSEAKKEEIPATKGGFTFGNVESSPLPSASLFVLGRTEEKQQEPVTSTSLVFGKKADNEEPKCQTVFSFGNSEQTKDESSSKSTFSFTITKPSEKESEQPTKTTFAFGVQNSTTADQGVPKPVFSLLNNSSSNSSTPATSSSGSIFGSSTFSSSAPVAAFVFGQASNPVSSSAFGNSAESSTSQSLLFSQDSKPATTSSTGTTVTPFVFGPGASSNNTATSGFSFGATTTSSSAGSSFVFGTGPSAPSASPAFGANQTPTFGQSQGASQLNPPCFGSISSSATLFSAGSQPAPPTFGTVSSSSQPPVFGQQPGQSAFGSGTAPNSSSVFQFARSATNFSFTNNNASGIFTFGANPSTPAASAQPSGSGGFPSAFTLGSNGKNMFSSSGTSVSGRKIKTAVRRRK
ncbi:nuclear pore complex protein Nup153 isoform X1 [Rousettus aegyptiacus]|uniref:Nuclear pore complex protein Nup153 n=5 Tax=Rousettus aegyptiacus TaxID=9407 RepID=A0A7J8KDM7_ROUAE|nr:nuclear pore complex protein Nup153 isoform X1 [Rousettus aegyptiacus]KAF6506939.1 nucleoporin 153 [Rousettus aegyptiacus]